MGKSRANEADDDALVLRIASGEAEALRELNRRYGRLLIAVAMRILANREDAEEAAADVLWQVWREASRFDRRRGSVGAWLMMLARTRSIDLLRSRKSRTPPSDEPSHEEPGTADPAIAIQSMRWRERIRGELNNLGTAERSVLELAYFSDLSQSEIAARTGIPLGTIKSRMRSALVKLRAALGGLEE